MASHEERHRQSDDAQDAGPRRAEAVLHVVAATDQAIDGIEDRIDAGQGEDGAAEDLDEGLQVPVAVLEPMAAFQCDQARHRQRGRRQHHVDQAVHAIEHDGLRMDPQAADHADGTHRRRERDRELEQPLLGAGVHVRHLTAMDVKGL